MDGPGYRAPVRTLIRSVGSPDALRALGRVVGERLFEGAVVLLDGELGAGKTTFVQGVAEGNGVAGVVPSPTYALVLEYDDGRVPLRHADVYRMESAEELVSAGVEERVGEEGAWLVEWASRFPGRWPPGHLAVHIGMDGEGRVVELVPTDAAHARLVPGT